MQLSFIVLPFHLMKTMLSTTAIGATLQMVQLFKCFTKYYCVTILIYMIKSTTSLNSSSFLTDHGVTLYYHCFLLLESFKLRIDILDEEFRNIGFIYLMKSIYTYIYIDLIFKDNSSLLDF